MSSEKKEPKVTVKPGEIIIKKEDWRGFVAETIVIGYLIAIGYCVAYAPAMFDRVTSAVGPLVAYVVAHYFVKKGAEKVE